MSSENLLQRQACRAENLSKFDVLDLMFFYAHVQADKARSLMC